MRNLFYSSLFILLMAASLLVVTLLLRSRDLNVTIIEPVHQEKKETPTVEKTEKIPVQKVSGKKSETVKNVGITEEKPAAEKVAEPVSAAGKEPAEKSTAVVKKVIKVAEKVPAVQQIKTEIAAEEIKVSPKTPAAETAKKVPAEKKSLSSTEEMPEETTYKCEWLEDFDPDGHLNGVKYVDNWKREGGVIFTPKTRFYLKKDPEASAQSVLVIESRKSSAVFANDLSKVIDLDKTPILRWRWRVKKLPPFGDGRHKKRDDQAVGIYIGTGTAFNQKAISYRWETETPLGHWGKTVYSNVMNVWFYCLRNKHSGLNVWHEETRNVRQDFLDKYGFVPEKIALVICGNSQNSKSDALAEIDHIGFYKEVKQKGK